jgi:hypothetical protein
VRTALLAALLAASAFSQPRIGIIDFYGQRRVPPEKLAKAIGVRVGDPLPPNKVDLEEQIETVDGVTRAHVEATCCAAGKAILYIGVEERGARHFEPRMPGIGADLSLPAADDTDGLIAAVRQADDSSVRADAAALLGDAEPAQPIVEALQFAAQDHDPTVRRAAVRGLVRMHQAADSNRELQVLPTWIVEMLNSVVWTDRVNAVEALLAMTDRFEPTLIGKIRDAGFDSLLQMAQWQHLEHALPPYLLLCRISGIPDTDAQTGWSAGERDRVIAQIQKGSKKK